MKLPIRQTDFVHYSRENHMIDAMMYGISCEMAKQLDDWVLLHIAPKPKWIPLFIYHWLIKKLFIIKRFKI
jgi:hypothetical protein